MKNPFIISIYIILIVFSIVGNLDARTLKIGSMSPLTGPYEINGSDIKNGALIAISDIIESGGISGFDRIKLFPQDTACNPGSAVLAANILINLKVVGVIGAYCSSSTIPASEVLKEYDIVMITPASTNEKVTSRGLPYMFRLANNSDPKKVAEVTLKHIKKRFNARSAFLINSNENYSRNLKSEIINLGDSYSIRLDEIEIQKNSNGSHRLVQMARGFNPDVICLTRMSLRNASLIISNLKRNLDNTKIIVSDLYWDTDLDTSRFRSSV